jgi:hypothetical protein
MTIKLVVATLLTAALTVAASAAHRILGIPEGGTGTASGPSAVPFAAPGATSAAPAAPRAGRALNVVDDFGARGDGQQLSAAVTATAGNPTVTVAGASYTAFDVGKSWAATGLGQTLTTGSITAAALTSGGAGYTSLPTIAVSGFAGPALLYPVMQIDSITLATGGAGCTAGAQTFTISGLKQQDAAATFTGTVSGGVLSGALTLTNPGSFVYAVAAAATPTGGGCTTAPTVNVTYKVGAIRVSNGGMGVPLAGVTASISGGAPTTAATLGAVTVTPTTKVHKSTIAAVNSATSITLTAPPQKTLAGSTQTVFWGVDDAPAFQAALNSCNPIHIPNGSYWVGSTVTLPTTCLTKLKGAGRDLTKIVAIPGLSADVLATAGFASLVGSGSADGSHRAVIEDLTVDGNRTAQDWPAAGTPDSVNGIALYGAALKMDNVAINNVLGHCLQTEWVQNANVNGVSLQNGMPPSFNHIAIDTCGRHAFYFKGPHDGHFEDMMLIDASQEQDVAYSFIHTADGYANGRFTHIHPWHRSTSLNRAAWDFYSGGGNQITNSHLEGARGWIYHAGGGDTLVGSRLYALFPFTGGVGTVFAGTQNAHVGVTYSGPGDANPVYGFQYGVSSAAKGAQTMLIGATVNGFAQAPFNFAFDGGGNTIVANGYKNAAVAWEGAPVSTDIFQWKDQKTAAVSFPGLSAVSDPQTSVISGGKSHALTGSYSAVTGGAYCDDRGRDGYECFGGGAFAAAGTSQIGRTILARAVTNAAPSQLTWDGQAPGTSNTHLIMMRNAFKLRQYLI